MPHIHRSEQSVQDRLSLAQKIRPAVLVSACLVAHVHGGLARISYSLTYYLDQRRYRPFDLYQIGYLLGRSVKPPDFGMSGQYGHKCPRIMRGLAGDTRNKLIRSRRRRRHRQSETILEPGEQAVIVADPPKKRLIPGNVVHNAGADFRRVI